MLGLGPDLGLGLTLGAWPWPCRLRSRVARNFRQEVRQSVAILSVHSRSAALPSRLSLIDKNIDTSARFYA